MDVLQQLLQELNNLETLPTRRVEIGIALSILGDPRPGVGLGANKLPDIVWCQVEPLHATPPPAPTLAYPFYLAMYPITHGQFKAFFDAPDGYANVAWWDGLPNIQQPWKNNTEALNAPVDNIAWVNAVAFCRWLTHHQRTSDYQLYPLDLDHDAYEIRLPTEQEWIAAMSPNPDLALYPWGTMWLANYANSRETKLMRTASVGMFPHGVAACGAHDMVGNTWEWCLYDAPTPANEDKRYPLRGASCFDDPANLTWKARLTQHALSRNNISSFRVVYARKA